MKKELTISEEMRREKKKQLAKDRKFPKEDNSSYFDMKGWSVGRSDFINKNREDIIKIQKENLDSWSNIVPLQSRCQICGRDVYFNRSNRADAIHFDHRKDGFEPIGSAPTSWLKHHKATPENVKLWIESDFGILCGRCNKFLPTAGRKEFMEKAIGYMYGKEIKENFLNMI